MNQRIAQAVRDHRIVTFWYNGLLRTVEPHTYGVTMAGHEALSGYQAAGGSHSGDLPGWRLFLLSEISNLTVTDRTFARTRPGYNSNDSRMCRILARACQQRSVGAHSIG
jgi:hypothetical protein